MAEEVLRDPLFVSNVLLKGRLEKRIEIVGSELRVGDKLDVGSGLKLVSGYLSIDGKHVSVRALVVDGEVRALHVEPPDVDLEKLSSRSIALTIYEVPRELVDKYPQLRELIGEREKVREVRATQRVATVIPSTRTVPREIAAKPEAIAQQDVFAAIEHMLDSCNLAVEQISIVPKSGKFVVNVVARNRTKKFVDHDIATYVIVAALAKALGTRFASIPIEVGLELDGKSKNVALRDEEDRWKALANGMASYIAMRHGFKVDKVRTYANIARRVLEAVINVKSIYERATPEVLQQIAFESVREIKMLWMGRVRVRAKSGRFTEGSAEA